MNELTLLHKLAEYQQYAELKDAAQALWEETHNPDVLPFLALAHANLGFPKSAREWLAQAQQHQGDYDFDALVVVAGTLIVMQRLDEAVTLLQEVVEHNSEHALAAARLGYCYTLQQQLEEATPLLEKAAKLEPHRIPVMVNLAGIYLMQAQGTQAQQQLEAGIKSLHLNVQDYPDFVVAQNRQLLRMMQLRIWIDSEQFAVAEQWLQTLFDSTEASAGEGLKDQQYWVEQYARLLAEQDYHDQAVDILREYLARASEGNENSSWCLQLAELAQLRGQFMPAVNLLRRALKQDEENVDLWVQLSSACLHRFDQQARGAADKAMEFAQALQATETLSSTAIAMQQAKAKNALAQVECLEQNFAEAEKLFEEILAEHEYFLPALQGLGQQKMQQGEIDAAIALFERVKALDPVKGYSALINARQFPEDAVILEKMEQAAARPSLEGKACAGILFQLASAWEKRQDYDRAFKLAEQANIVSKKFLPYDGKAHRNECYRTRMRFSKALYQHRQDCGVDSALPVYVLGMPRSGTTLIEQVLAGHSQIFGAGELGVIPQAIQGLKRWERHTGSGRKYPDCVDDLTPYVVAGIANKVLKELQEYDDNAKHVIDKLPHNFQNIGLIKFLFPNARIISVRRDPRDIALSNYFTDYQAKHGGMGFAYDLEDIGEQLADHNLMMQHWQDIFPNEILEVNYEDVVDDLEGSARRMLDYIGVDWEPEVLHFNKLERAVKTASVWQVRQPIYKTSKAKWRRYKKYLGPLIKGTNAKILPDPMTNMITLPEPGFLIEGVALYQAGKLDKAELSFQKMLHHNPAHAACHYMLGLVYLSLQHYQAGIEKIEMALATCPWQKEWRDNLIKAYETVGEEGKAAKLRQKPLQPSDLSEADGDGLPGSSLSSVA